MSNRDLTRKMNQIRSSDPVGVLTPVGNGHSLDELGRVFFTESYEERERKRKQAYKKQDKRHFTFSHMVNMREVAENLPNKYCGYTLMLQPYIHFKTNIVSNNGRNPEPMNKKEIAKIFDVQSRTAETVLEKLKDYSVLEENRDGHFIVNKKYHFRNKARGDVDKLVKTYSTMLKKLNLSPAHLGVIYKILPYVHYETNLVCKNPFEEFPGKVDFYNKNELAGLIGVSRSKISEILSSLTSAGVVVEIKRKSSIISETQGDKRETVIALNPEIVSRIQGEHENKFLLQLFNNT